ncbi:MAG: glycoside hydrolase family 2, partial [bacterium]|nr:glycoside hydrolase family 2 [bacterium]
VAIIGVSCLFPGSSDSRGFWRDISALNGYIARCQSILQSGEPDNDILLYWPVYDEWHRPDGLTHGFTVHHIEWFTEAPVGKLAQELLDKGYTFDLVSDAQIRGLSVEEGRIVTEAGVPYRTVLVPRTTYMPVDTLESLAAVANEGGSVLFHEALPADVPGYLEVEVRRAALEAVRDAFGLGADNGSGLQRSQVGKGMAALSGDTGLLLAEPEVAAEPLTQHGIGFIRRVHPQGRHYFLANQGTSALDGWVALATRADSAVLLCPTTERTGLGEVRQQDGRTEVYLQLQPGETLFLRTFEERIVDGEAWEYRVPRGLGVALENPWRVEFIDGGPALPKAYTAKTLVSWADRDNPRAKRFAGTALYSTEFDLPGNVECDDWMVDLGNVRESARVRVNGVDAGVLWSIPYTARVGHLLRPGKNRLEVEVTNLSANRIRDLDVRGVEWRIFHDINFVDQNYNKFDASKWPLQDSGLLGPVTLVPLAAVQPTG